MSSKTARELMIQGAPYITRAGRLHSSRRTAALRFSTALNGAAEASRDQPGR
jgi:hypothetical protein